MLEENDNRVLKVCFFTMIVSFSFLERIHFSTVRALSQRVDILTTCDLTCECLS